MGIPCKIRVHKPLEHVYPLYQPELGKVYDAEYIPGKVHSKGDATGRLPFCIVNIKDKRIVVRKNEFEFVEDDNETD